MSNTTRQLLGVLDVAPGWITATCRRCNQIFNWPANLMSAAAGRMNRDGLNTPICDACDGLDVADEVEAARQAGQSKPVTDVTLYGMPSGTDKRDMRADVARWLRDPAALTLYLYGPTGSGKTTQIAALLRYWLTNESASVVYRTEKRLLDGLRDFQGGKAGELMRDVCTCDLLVVDDVGVAHAPRQGKIGDGAPQSSWQYEQWYDLLDSRYQSRKTVFASNLSPEDFLNRPGVDDRLRRRITYSSAQIALPMRYT